MGEIIPQWWATSSGISTQGKGIGSTVPRRRVGLKDGMKRISSSGMWQPRFG
jgi:hypothetical protein